MLEKIEGMIIKTQDYSETHKIVTIYSGKVGKFSALARGAKKPKSKMAAVTQPFIYGAFLIYLNKGLSTIQQGDILNSYRPIREDIMKTAYAAYVTELTDKILETKMPDSYIFKQFLLTIDWIAENETYLIPILMYELKLYRKGGFAPVVNQCVNCHQNKELVAFSISEGGVLCANCRYLDTHPLNISPRVIKLLHTFLNVGLEQVGSISIKASNQTMLRQLLDAYYDHYGGYYLKSRRFLRQIDDLT